MKIGIITFWESTDNYGQVLQAYALQQMLKSMGHEPFQIKYSLSASQSAKHKDFTFMKILKVVMIFPLIKVIKRHNALRNDRAYRLKIEKKNEMRKFDEFRSKYIDQDETVYNSIEEIRSNPPSADCYITGSDQVWAMLLSDEGNAAYYLDFGDKNTKRISYAASFGRAAYPTELLPRLKELITRFNAISVREQEGLKICESVGTKAELVLDPTLLFTKTDYLNKLNIKDEVRDKSLFVYSINVRIPEDLYWSRLKQYAASNGLKITVTTSSGNIPGREIYEDAEYSYATLENWIRYINKAQLVVTTSFHGIVFCLLMHTNFVFVPLRRNMAIGNGRVISLLSFLGLENKICHNESDYDNCVSQIIDWDKIENKMKSVKQSSVRFLAQSLSSGLI